MFDKFNNVWIILLAFILLYVIIRKIINFNKPFDEKRFIEQYQNQIKLKKKFKINNIKQKLPQLA